MNKFEAMRAFCLVADNQSFSAAAGVMGVSATMISRYVKQLEQELGCLLLKRNTRKVFLTDAGDRYRQHVNPLLKKLAIVEQQMVNLADQPSGQLTVSASLEFGGQYLVPVIKQYRDLYPNVQLNFNLSNTPVDLFNSDVDLAFRVAPSLPNASHIAQEISSSKLALWASPGYLDKNGHPETLEDLRTHKLLFFAHNIRKDQWIFLVDGKKQAMKFNWDWRSDNGRLLNESAASGLGIIQAPGYSVAPYVKTGALIEILPQFSIPKLTISAVYPHRYELSNRVKTFIEVAKGHFEQHPIP